MTRKLVVALGALALAACGQQTTETTTETQTAETPGTEQTAQMTDADFVSTVAASDAFEIQSSELAAQRAARQDVKDFAGRMVTEHRATTQELTQLASQLNMTAPTPALSSAMQGRIDSLRGQSGEAFDDAYLDAQVNAYEEAVRAFETYLASAQPGPLRDWANNTLPKLCTHLSQVQNLENAT